MQRNSANVLPVSSAVTVASHTWVVRPPWANRARQTIAPSRTVPRKFALSSIVVNPVAPSGSTSRQPKPQAVSASPTTVAACR